MNKPTDKCGEAFASNAAILVFNLIAKKIFRRQKMRTSINQIWLDETMI